MEDEAPCMCGNANNGNNNNYNQYNAGIMRMKKCSFWVNIRVPEWV